MVTQSYKVKSAKLANGETVFVNDHVYVSPPWSERDGTPYNVARIIEFIPPDSTPRKGRGPSQEISVRLSLYYRQTDISARNVSDFRLLLATIHTDVHPLANVRGKCYVRHKDRIEDLIKWKRLPDHFYFAKFFDPYIRKEYEVIRTENVRNIPPEVREVLLSRYEYLVAEREIVPDLTDSFRACCVCDKWAASQDSVRCEACKNHYHMACVTPPITAKPAKGYSWVCLPCSLQRRKDVEDQKFHYGASSAPAPKPKAGLSKSKDKVPMDLERPDVSYRGWPWRYFGLYTRAEDTLDPDDLIFPRAATRIGRNFQTHVPTWEEQQEAESHRVSGEAEAGPSRHIGVERGHDVGERRHESSIDIWCTPSADLNTYMNDLQSLKMPVPPYNVDRLNRGVLLYTTLGHDRALKIMRGMRLDDFPPKMFTPEEVAIFEAQLEENGGLDTHKTAQLINRTPAEVLRFSYIWKNGKLKEENEALRAHHKVSHSHARQNKTLGAPSLGRIRGHASSTPTDDEVSLYDASFISTNKLQCAACSTKISSAWWRCPRTVPGNAMCEDCGSNYRKYGVISFVKADDVKKSDKDKLKKKVDGVSGASTPVPPAPKLPPCASCRRMEPKSNMARCKICTYSVHSGCYGIAPQDIGLEWVCELCHNVETEMDRLEPHCVLCPREQSSVKNIKSKKPLPDFDLLSALKPTEGNLWCHIICSIFWSEILYRDTKTFKEIEGVTLIPEESWSPSCTLCNQVDGAVIACVDCLLPFHPSCAWLSGYKIGFEFTLAKAGKREVITTAFKEHEGVMLPGCWCKSHDLEGRTIYDPFEIDPELNETALQVYAASYKGVPADDSFPLLRKARGLAHVLPAVPVHEEYESKSCKECGIDVSPIWHKGHGVSKVEAMEVDLQTANGNGAHGLANGHAHDQMDIDSLQNGVQDKGPSSLWLCHQCSFKS
ncbi:hypothetical protein BD324DRAFT_635569 [Kockovaella imperatae]|uniref:Uncharacterized protein n=1 Tax=Kockovaella imperatae TaxID=4999 RepID=A0A1Y1U8J4_9TREE|nr:hypothetical protein BD324DRAFT_635569 [Kockovaella imperatae]ORX34360.1 hypothetical protein BD324DRAFT_635569 [Kockovaella imperatae]